MYLRDNYCRGLEIGLMSLRGNLIGADDDDDDGRLMVSTGYSYVEVNTKRLTWEYVGLLTRELNRYRPDQTRPDQTDRHTLNLSIGISDYYNVSYRHYIIY